MVCGVRPAPRRAYMCYVSHACSGHVCVIVVYMSALCVFVCTDAKLK